MKRSLMLLGLVGLVVLCGCKHGDPFSTKGDDAPTPIKPADITYNELADRYNQAVEPLGTIWARTDVVMRWREQDGEVRREQGEGKLMLRQPAETAFLIEKLGKTYLWAGSDADRYWLFDLVDGENKTAFVGSFDQVGVPGGRRFPLPIRPDVMPALLGLTPLPLQFSQGDTGSSVSMYDGQYLVVTPGERMRLLVDPDTFRPTRVDLTNADGFSVLTAKLEGKFGVEVPGVRKSRWPIICERAQVFVSGYESRMTIAMDFATNNPRRVRDPMFDFEALSRALKPGRVESLDPQ